MNILSLDSQIFDKMNIELLAIQWFDRYYEFYQVSPDLKSSWLLSIRGICECVNRESKRHFHELKYYFAKTRSESYIKMAIDFYRKLNFKILWSGECTINLNWEENL